MKNKDIAVLRDLILLENEGLCMLCKEVCERPVLDHSHFSGKIRGTICSQCNVLLGRYENGAVRSGRKDRMLAIAENLFTYLTGEREEIHPVHGKVKKRRKKPVKVKVLRTPLVQPE